MKLRKKHLSGFTLIELMITVAIIAILVAIAFPAYQDYTIRSEAAEGLSLAQGAKPVVAEFHSNHGAFPNNNSDAGYSGATGKYITSTTVGNNGVITATFGGDANSKITNQTITLTPNVQSEGNVSWNCTSSMESKYLPSSCTHVSSGGNGNSGGTVTSGQYFGGLFSLVDGKLYFTGGGSPTELTAGTTNPDGSINYNLGPLSGSGANLLTMRSDGMVQYGVAPQLIYSLYPDQSVINMTQSPMVDASGTSHNITMYGIGAPSGYTPPANVADAMTNLTNAANTLASNVQYVNGQYQPVYTQANYDAYQTAIAQAQQAIRNTISSGTTLPKVYQDFLNYGTATLS